MSPKEAIESQLPKPDLNGLRLINDVVEIKLPLDLRCWAQIKAYKQEDFPSKMLMSKGVVWIPSDKNDNSIPDHKFGEASHFIRFMDCDVHTGNFHGIASENISWKDLSNHSTSTRGKFKVLTHIKKECTWILSLRSIEAYIISELSNLYGFIEGKEKLIKDREEAMKSEGVEYFLRNTMENAAKK